MTVKVGIAGAGGRMGRFLVEALAQPGYDAVLAAAVERPGSELLGSDAGQLAGLEPNGVLLTDRLDAALAGIDVLIDFTSPATTVAHARACRDARKALVVGTTGLDSSQQAEIDAAADLVPVCQASNFSTGVNLLFRLLAQAAGALGDSVDVEIIEAHHRHKVDAPSGTALSMGKVIAKQLGRELDDVAVYGREGQTGPRARPTIGFSTIRGGDIVGDHTVLFAADGERIELTHRAGTRMAFASGAVRAAVWLPGRAPARYDMSDVLGFTGEDTVA